MYLIVVVNLAFIASCLLPGHVWAFSWARTRQMSLSESPVRDATPGQGVSELTDALIMSGIAQDEVDTLFLKTSALEEYSRKPDCFRRSAGLLRNRCGETDMNEHERVKAAISMTLCELATARHHSVPLECAAFDASSLSLDATAAESHGDCVEALSRSAQFWSSYSGYLREVPQLCYAFRRWNDIDTAKDIYKNATLEKISLIRFIMNREKSARETQQGWEQLREDMHDVLRVLHASAVTVEDVSSGMKQVLGARFEEGLHLLKTAFVDLQRRSDTDQARSLLQIETALDRITEGHADSLDIIIASVEHSVSSRLHDVFLGLDEEHRAIFELSRDARALWGLMATEFTSMHQTIIQLSETATDAAIQLDRHAQQARVAQQTQLEVSQSAAGLAEAIDQLSTAAYTQLEKINDTALTLRNSLLPVDYSWWKSTLLPAMEMVLRVDPTYLEYLSRLPVFRIVLTLVHILYYLSQSLFSSVMSVLLLFLSSKRWFSRRSSDQIQEGLDDHLMPRRSHPRTPFAHPVHLQRYSLPSNPGDSRRRSESRVSRIPSRLYRPNSDRVF